MEWFLDRANMGKIDDEDWGIDTEDESYVPSTHLSDVLNQEHEVMES
jgi:hypothetical protein